MEFARLNVRLFAHRLADMVCIEKGYEIVKLELLYHQMLERLHYHVKFKILLVRPIISALYLCRCTTEQHSAVIVASLTASVLARLTTSVLELASPFSGSSSGKVGEAPQTRILSITLASLTASLLASTTEQHSVRQVRFADSFRAG